MLNPTKLADPSNRDKAIESLERARDILIEQSAETITLGDLYEISVAVMRALTVVEYK